MKNAHPPLAAKLILALTADENYRAPIIGDLDEEFIRRRQLSHGGANLWYIRQALLSMPYLFWIKIIERPKQSRTVILFTGALAYALIMAWDSLIGSNLTNWIAENFLESSSPARKFVFSSITLVAVALVGSVVAGIFFDERAALRKNLAAFLPIIYGALVFFAGFKRLFVACDNSALFQLAVVASVAPALTIGASLTYWAQKAIRRTRPPLT